MAINPEVIPSNIKLKTTPINVSTFFGGGGGGAIVRTSSAIAKGGGSDIIKSGGGVASASVEINARKISILKNILKYHQDRHNLESEKLS